MGVPLNRSGCRDVTGQDDPEKQYECYSRLEG